MNINQSTRNMELQEIEYHSKHGTKFKCDMRDLSDDVDVMRPEFLSDIHFAQDTFEFGAWHAMQIWPTLNGFQGYDTVKFKIDIVSSNID